MIFNFLDAALHQAFTRGFLQGLAAPAQIFMPPRAPEPVVVEMIEPVGPRTAREAMARNWAALGHDLQVVIQRHGEKAR